VLEQTVVCWPVVVRKILTKKLLKSDNLSLILFGTLCMYTVGYHEMLHVILLL